MEPSLREYQDRAIVLESLPRIAYLALTGRCNLRCEHCLSVRETEENRDISDEVYDRFCAEILPTLEEVNLGGNNYGEQLLSNRVPDFLDRADRAGVRVMIVTNGTMLQGPIVSKIVEHVARIRVSAEGVGENYEKIRHVKYDRFVRNVEGLLEARRRAASPLVVEIGFSACKTNINDLFELLAIGVDALRVHYIQPKDSDWERQTFTLAEVDDLDRSFYPRLFEEAARSGVRVDCVKPGRSRGLSVCPEAWTQVSVRETGDVLPCHVAGDGLIMGNIRHKPFIEVWNGRRYQKLRKSLLEHKPQETCRVCGGIYEARGFNCVDRCRKAVKSTLVRLGLHGTLRHLKSLRRAMHRL